MTKHLRAPRSTRRENIFWRLSYFAPYTEAKQKDAAGARCYPLKLMILEGSVGRTTSALENKVESRILASLEPGGVGPCSFL